MWAGVSKSGSPISRWTMSLPCRSRALARANTSKADSVPSRDMRPAKIMVPMIILDAMELVEVAAGWFWMGWEEGDPGERPRHRVWIDGFAIARAPVTNAEYARFLETSEAPPPPWWEDPRFNEPDQPVVGINWFEAALYCESLSGGRHRLPTEAEWEKAARGGLEG